MLFHAVAYCFSQIEAQSSRTEKTKLLADLIANASASEAKNIAYLSLGELYPPYINKQFQIAQKTVLKVIARLTDNALEDVEKLYKKCGDVGLCVTELYHAQKDHSMMVLQVYEALSQLMEITGTGSQETKEQHLADFCAQLDPLSARYVVRIVVGELRLGFSDMTLLDAVSWAITGDKSLRKYLENAYNVSADIGLVVKTLKDDGIEGVKSMHSVPGIPIRPAAAERLPDAYAIIEKLGKCASQPKLDGLRLQVHVFTDAAGKNIRFFSRNLQEMSHMFPDLASSIAELGETDFIAEGEAIAFDPANNKFLPFQETSKRRRKHGVAEAVSDYPMRFYFFDLLFYKGASCMAKNHAARRELLRDLLAKNHAANLFLIQETLVESGEHLEEIFYHELSEGLEGVVVKRLDANYKPGKRDFNWIKLKRQEEGALIDTLDCVILGFYAGTGKRASHGIGALLVGVLNEKTQMLESIAKVGSGFKDEDILELKKLLNSKKVAGCPSNVRVASELEPDTWIAPEMVILVRADEISLSPSHTAGKTEKHQGYALRFPRYMGLRIDKSAPEATTVHEVKELFEQQVSRSEG